MSKLKRISLVVVTLAMFLSLLAVHSFAYLTEEGITRDLDVFVPSVTTTVRKTNGITQTPTAFAPASSGGWYYRAGNVDNSVRIVVADGGYYTDYNIEYDSIHYEAVNAGVLSFTMTSVNDFEFYLDMADTLGALSPRYYSYLEDTIPLQISAKVGVYSNINSDGLPYGAYTSLNAFSDFSVNLNYVEGRTPYTNYLNRVDTSNIYYNIYDGVDTQAVTAVSGYINRPDGVQGYLSVSIQIFTNGTNPSDRPHYFNGSDTTLTAMTSKYDSYILELYEDAAYSYGYDVGHTDGYEEGYQIGAEESIEHMGIFSVFTKSIDALLDFPLFDLPNGDNISLGLLLGVIVGAMAFVWLLKLIAGG